MTRLRQIALGGATAALLMGGAVSESFAVESGAFQYLAGASIGIPGGAAAPPGLYSAFEPFWNITAGMTGNQGNTGPNGGRGTALGAAGGVVPLVWSTGWNVFGANYSVAIIQPFVTALVNATGAISANNGFLPGETPGAIWQQMIINTVWQPLNMSWNLGNGWFAAIAFSFQAPIGTHVTGIANPDFWEFLPGLAFSYLSANFVGTVNMSYNIYTASQGVAMNLGGTPFGVGYTSGNQFVGDWDALWKFGKWSIGPVGYWVWQTTSDTAGGGGCAALANPITGIPGFGCARQSSVAFGGLIGYDFGPVDFQVWVVDPVWQENTGQAGVTVFSRIGFKIWGPEAPAARPLVSKN
jgi:hypothetical protein